MLQIKSAFLRNFANSHWPVDSALQWASDIHKLFKIGFNCLTVTRTINKWIIEQ